MHQDTDTRDVSGRVISYRETIRTADAETAKESKFT